MADGITSGNSSSSKHLMWMTAGLFVGMGVMMAGGLFMAGRVIRSVGLTAAMNGRDKIRTPGGDFRLEKEGEMGPRLVLYPRVSLELPDANQAAETLKEAQSGIKVVVYQSSDPRVFVDDWYKSHLTPDFTRYDAGDKPLADVFKMEEAAESEVAFVSEKGNKVGIIALAMDDAGTKISLIRIEKKESGAAPATQDGMAAPTGAGVDAGNAASPQASSGEATPAASDATKQP